jgi:hypothetical protein
LVTISLLLTPILLNSVVFDSSILVYMVPMCNFFSNS